MSPRSKVSRHNPELARELRAAIVDSLAADPAAAQMAGKGRMKDGDLIDFALNVAVSHFRGDFQKHANDGLQLAMLRTATVIGWKLGALVTIDAEGNMVATPRQDLSDETLVQARDHVMQTMIDAGMRVEEARLEVDAAPITDRAGTWPDGFNERPVAHDTGKPITQH